ncbi:DUF4129 domain-containing protein [Nonomuraea sp. H19]|uniref:DUF4129 domain-containing protein n=1 Tax=Nonomuraea sp. H19 TaxID=3452206 RepID=UPI003F887C5F
MLAFVGSGSPIDRDEAARRAAEELIKPEYDKESLADQLYRRFMQFLGDLVDAATGGGTAGGIIAAVVIVLIILAVIVLISWQLRKTARKRAPGVGDLFGERAMTADEHRQAAERLAADGRWSEAIQERLRAIARDLEARALVDGMPGRTADELAAEAAVALPGFATELAAAARSFDDVTYGGVPGTREAYEAMSALDTQLRQARPIPLAVPVGAGVGTGIPPSSPAGGPVGGPAGGPVGGPAGGPVGGPAGGPAGTVGAPVGGPPGEPPAGPPGGASAGGAQGDRTDEPEGGTS